MNRSIFTFSLALLISLSALSQKTSSNPGNFIPVTGIVKNIPDSAILEIVQRQTFRFFWHYAHPVSGLARERSNTVLAEHYWDYINEAWDEPNFSKTPFGPDACAIGGTGFGIMATIVAVERGWIERDTAVGRLVQIADFLANADCFHGIYPHFMDGRTGKTIKFDRIDDAADIVETSYLLMGFLCAREYFNSSEPREVYLRNRITKMWNTANWNWHTNGEKKLYWHWSPNNGFDMNFPVWGYNECLITYIMAASSPWHPISKDVYDGTWAGSAGFKNGRQYYGITLPLGNYEGGGPLFFEQYTYMGIDPRGLVDSLGNDYFMQGKNHTLINRAYCIDNPRNYKGYGENCWGLTAGDSYKGYVAHCPDTDFGVIQPTAALSSFPYTPEYSMEALKHFYYNLGDRIWSDYGFVDGFSEHHDWYAKSHLAIDQGPIVVMIENYRTGLLWDLFMQIPDIQRGLKRLGFDSPWLHKKPFRSFGRVDYPVTPGQALMLDTIQEKTFRFFMEQRHPEWGLVKDRTTEWAPASIASTGFGIPCFAIGAERKYISREEAAEITLDILEFFMNSTQNDAKDATGYRGFYYHFLELEKGQRTWNCELSSVDTGLLMMGIIFARNYYDRDNETENRIRMLAGILLNRIDWEFMKMPDNGRFANTISMGWTPEKGQHDHGWSGYNEALFLYVLAAGTGMKDAEKSYEAWLSTYKWNTPYTGLSHVAFPPLFGHQFSQAFIDCRGLVDPYMKEKGIDYFENSRRATYVQRNYAVDNPYGWVGYDSLCWGVTASDGPTDKYNFGDKKFLGYAGRGSSGPDYNYFDDGTIAPYGPLSSLPFAPEIVLPTAKSMLDKYGDRLWGRYGFYDAFNLTANWFDNDYVGIDQGPMLIMIENFRTGLVWNYMMKDEIIQDGLERLGFESLRNK